jgi:hypothetical protein
MVLALPELILYALLFLTLALAFASRKITQALFGQLIALLQSIPAIGGYLASPFEAIERAIVDACGSIEGGCDRAMGWAWHNTARLLDETWRAIKSHAAAIASIAPIVGTLVAGYHVIRALVHDLTRAWHGIEHLVKRLEKEWHGIEARVKQLERDLTRGIGHDLHIGLRKLEKEWHTFRTRELPALEADVAAIPGEIAGLRKWIADNVPLVGTTALVGAVAWALGQLGLGGLRCPSFLNSLNKRGCGLWNGLEDVLGLLVDGLIFLDLCHVIPTVEGLFADFEAPLVELVSAGANAACAHPPKGWVELPAPTIYGPTSSEITATL